MYYQILGASHLEATCSHSAMNPGMDWREREAITARFYAASDAASQTASARLGRRLNGLRQWFAARSKSQQSGEICHA